MRLGYRNRKSGITNLIIVLTLILLAGVVWYSYYSNVFTGLLYNDAMDYASMGRNIARGEGVVSSYITPLGLQYFGVPHPNPWRAPLWPVVLAFSMKFLGYHDNAVALTTGVFFILTVPLIFLIGNKLWGRIVGFLAAMVFAFSNLALHFSVSGLTEPLAAFLLSLWIYALIQEKLHSPAGAFVIGIIGGIFYLARYNALVFLPFFLIYLLWHKKESWLRVGTAFTVGFLAPLLPWFWRNYTLFGSPMFSLQKFEPVMFTPTYPDYTLYMMMKKPDVLKFLTVNYSEVAVKFLAGLDTFKSNLLSADFTGIHYTIMILFLVSLLVPLGEKAKGVKLVLAGSFLAQLGALLVIHYIPRLFFIFTPFYILLGLALIQRLIKLVPTSEYLKRVGTFTLAGGITLFAVLGNWPDFRTLHNPEPSYKKFASQINYMAKVAKPADLIVSNDGHILSWYGDRNACKIPYSPGMLPELNGYHQAKYVFLSSRASWNIPEADKEWQKVYWSKPRNFEGYQLQQVFPDGSVVYMKK